MMTHGSLFSGRGTWDIVAQEFGFENRFYCEIDGWLWHKLRRISPDAERYSDIQNCRPAGTVDVLTASFPCQEISDCGARRAEGIRGKRSGLWREVKRIIADTQPGYVVLENSCQLVRKGLEVVMADLSEIGYDAEWDCFRGTDFGFPNRRKRIFVVAYPCSDGLKGFVLRLPGAFTLHRKWTPTASYLRCTAGRANGYRDIGAIQRGDVVHNFRREIHAFGNAVMPVIVEHIFRCILEDINNRL